MRILFVASEAVPYCKTGGLADVCGALPPALARLGHDVRVVVPCYREVDRRPLQFRRDPLGVPTGLGELWCAVGEPWPEPISQGARYFFLEYDRLYDRDGIYGPPGSPDYRDNCLRFSMLSRGALQLCRAWNWVPHVVHCHDWQTGLVPLFLRDAYGADPLGQAATVFTIHNLAYQGIFPAADLAATGLGWENFDWRILELEGSISLLKAGITTATVISTVSPTYAREIQTPADGCGLDPAIRYRSDRLRGILNGIDDEVWNPRKDLHLPARYDRHDLAGKQECKGALQRQAGLPEDREALVAGFIGRLVEQKGVDLIVKSATELAAQGVQLVLLGAGDPEIEKQVKALARRNPSFTAWLEFSEAKAHLIQAGADVILMPSRFEPCGLNQLHGLRYGTLPVVANVGGLRDSVIDGQEDGQPQNESTGFKLDKLTPSALVEAIGRARRLRQEEPAEFMRMIERAMVWPKNWDAKAQEYTAIYEEAVELAKTDGHRASSPAALATVDGGD